MDTQRSCQIKTRWKLDCVVEDNDSTVYRALYNGKPRHVRIWKSIPTDVTLQRLQYVQSTKDFHNPYQLINVQGQCGLLMQSMNGVSISTLQSSLSPKMVYEILARVCQHSINHIQRSLLHKASILSPQGNIFIYTPCLQDELPSIDSVWQIGWWALQKLSPTDGTSALHIDTGK